MSMILFIDDPIYIFWLNHISSIILFLQTYWYILHLKLKVKLEKYTFSVHQKEKWACSKCNITRIQFSLLLFMSDKTLICDHLAWNCDIQACFLSCLLTTIFKWNWTSNHIGKAKVKVKILDFFIMSSIFLVYRWIE